MDNVIEVICKNRFNHLPIMYSFYFSIDISNNDNKEKIDKADRIITEHQCVLIYRYTQRAKDDRARTVQPGIT